MALNCFLMFRYLKRLFGGTAGCQICDEAPSCSVQMWQWQIFVVAGFFSPPPTVCAHLTEATGSSVMLCHTPSHSTSFVSIAWQPAKLKLTLTHTRMHTHIGRTHTQSRPASHCSLTHKHTFCRLADKSVYDLLAARARCLANQDV